MAFQTGATSGPSELVTLLAAFATANGWTIGSSSDGFKVFQRAARGLYFSVAWNSDNIYVRGCTGYDSDSGWETQPGICPIVGIVNGATGPFKAYYFFGTEQYIHVVIEVSTNIFKHFVMGQLNKNSGYVGGAYFDTSNHYYDQSHTNYPESNGHRYLFDAQNGTNQNASVRVDSDGEVWHRYGYGDESAFAIIRGAGRGSSMTQPMRVCGNNAFNARTILQPIPLAVSRGSGLFSLIGSPPDIRFIQMNRFNPGQVITIGSDEWYVFPHIQKTYTHDAWQSPIPASGMYGYAYKRVD